MPAEFITPNLHVALIHFPLGILVVGTLIELFSFLWRRSSFRVAGRWMIGIGALAAIPATFSGIYALRDISRISLDTEKNWAQIKADSPVLKDPAVWEMLRHHTLYQSIATGVAALVVLVWLGSSDALRRSLHLVLLLILVGDVGLMTLGSHLGGQSVYTRGVGVEPVFPSNTDHRAAHESTEPADWTNTPTRIELMFPPLEMHVTMAGVAIAIAIASIGLSFRRITSTVAVVDEPIVTGDIVTGDAESLRRMPRTPPTSVEMVRTFNPDLELEVRPFVPAGRFWLLCVLLMGGTFLGGVWIIARDYELLGSMKEQPKQIPKLVWNAVKPESDPENDKVMFYRKTAHFVVGGAIVILPIFLAALARFAPREKIILSLLTFLLALAVTAQVWVGVLLLYDTGQGKLLYFNRPVAVESQ
jgi:uncharacterized membrane protein